MTSRRSPWTTSANSKGAFFRTWVGRARIKEFRHRQIISICNSSWSTQADYQYMQFKLVNSLRYMKSLGVNIVWTAWEDVRQIVSPDGTSYSQIIPKISLKIVDNICGLCDVVGKILVNKDNEHGILLEATQNIYAKNQIDTRKACKVEEFSKFKKGDK